MQDGEEDEEEAQNVRLVAVEARVDGDDRVAGTHCPRREYIKGP